LQKSCKNKKLAAENREMIEFRLVVLNKRIARPQVLRQYSAIFWPFFGTFYILSEEFNASLMNIHVHWVRKRDLCKTPPFVQFQRQTQTLILKILNVFLPAP